jgi:hypothetical protein
VVDVRDDAKISYELRIHGFFAMRRECFSGSPRISSLPQNGVAANAT